MPIRSDVRSSVSVARAMLHPRAFPEAAQQAFSAEPGDIDVKAVKRNRASDEALRLNKYEVELARGASHIASTLYEESMLAAVRETILQFEAPHGRDDLMTFAHALLRRLELREKPAAAKVLHDFIECGRLPEEIPSTPPRPVSARKPVARKVDGTDSRKSEARVTAKGA